MDLGITPLSAFTLIELLVVIGIIGILAALVAPVLSGFKRADATLAATRQMLDDAAYARQLAIGQHTTVYMVFCPSNFWLDPAFPAFATQTPQQRGMCTILFGKQLTGYALVSLRSVGDQPSRGTPRYLTAWRGLPENTFIAPWKFGPRNAITRIVNPYPYAVYDIKGFSLTNGIPFPLVATPCVTNASAYVTLPYLAFDYVGRLTSGEDEYIPLARGSVSYARDANKTPTNAAPSLIESPPNNSVSNFNIIHIDWLTGRARVERREIQ